MPKRGIGPTSIAKLAEFAESLNLGWFEAIDQLGNSNLSASLQTKFVRFSDIDQTLKTTGRILNFK